MKKQSEIIAFGVACATVFFVGCSSEPSSQKQAAGGSPSSSGGARNVGGATGAGGSTTPDTVGAGGSADSGGAAGSSNPGTSNVGGSTAPGTTGAGGSTAPGTTGAGGSTAPGTTGAGGSTGKGGNGGTGAVGGLAMTPPMGWNSWNFFKQNISEAVIKGIADAIVSSGMKAAGYQYVNIDDQWMKAGRVNGQLVPNPQKFPNGMKALADYVHSLGLKLGIYGDRGTMTCANIPESGSHNREATDAQTFASWGIDYLKYDNCNTDNDLQQDYERMSAALKATGRPIVFSLCAWGWKGDWMIQAGQLWRSTGDIADCWDDSCPDRPGYEHGILINADQNEALAKNAGPGHWNDPDMLEVGNKNLSYSESVAHFSLWCIMAAPLIAGNDLRNMTAQTKSVLTNAEAIAVDQDPAGIQGTRIVKGNLEVWMKPLGSKDGKEKAVLLLNRTTATAKITVAFDSIGITGPATVRDLWAHSDLGESTGSFSADVPGHGGVLVKIVQN